MNRPITAGLLAVLLLLAACLSGETECELDNGRVLIHNLTGNKWCDRPPYLAPGDGIFDLGREDYLID